MKCDFTDVRSELVTLLTNFESCKIEKDEAINKSYVMIVKRDKREREINCFDREIISVHDIEIFDVADDFIEVINDEKDDEIADAIDVKSEKSEENEKTNSIVVKDEKDEKNETNNFIMIKGEEGENVNAKNFDFFACFVRTCT